MTKKLYYKIGFVQLLQEAPAHLSEKLYIETIKTEKDRYDLVQGFGDPGQPRLFDVYDYAEFKIIGATFTKPKDLFETTQYLSENYDGNLAMIQNFNYWGAIYVPDNYLIPPYIPIVTGGGTGDPPGLFSTTQLNAGASIKWSTAYVNVTTYDPIGALRGVFFDGLEHSVRRIAGDAL